ncbi:integral membrane sensor signal transduction histidine kinase [Nakamurella sp. YIM 132087]|uniref:Integral membrane sensor signal transduction histidine kinase n=1 Tax=Nakamurella alba TaxID=2665158 RepID=A0A7K1FKQ4_9ACTN|nr:ATP-binding protein [Nakamurella alba]MTD14721.1 integral membrane sensor signal transduction histidine kinase [Nakamurella alba]
MSRPAPASDDRPPWLVVASGVPVREDRPIRRRRVFVQVIIGALVVLVVVSLGGIFAARRLAEAEAVSDAANSADLFAELLIQPVVTDGLRTGDPEALAAVDIEVREHLLTQESVVRVKIWNRDGTIVYSDDPRLIGMRFELEAEELEVFSTPEIRAEVSDLAAPENLYERDSGKLLETYRPIWTPDGQPLLFEVYFRYDQVTARSGELWRGFAGITLSSLLLLVALLLPILWRLLDRLREARTQREALLQRTIDASAQERRRIAGTLHDGVVQDLVGTSYALAGQAEQAAMQGRASDAEDLHRIGGAVRGSIGGLRSLLVDIYPPGLETAGLAATLEDMASGVRSRGVRVDLQVPDPSGLDAAGDRLVYRICQEALVNVGKHSGAQWVRVTLEKERKGGAVLEITDNGRGFDAEELWSHPAEGHFGLRVLADLANGAGATLRLSSAPGAGTSWRLEIPE